jgi:hypothetical protein
MTLPQEMINKIKTEAEKKYPFKWPVNSKGEDIVQRVGQRPYGWAKHQRIVKAYQAGATEWAGKANDLVDATEMLNAAIDKTWNECNTKAIPDKYKKEIAAAQAQFGNALAKYKEVGNA